MEQPEVVHDLLLGFLDRRLEALGPPSAARSTARREARRNVVRTAGPSTAIATAVVIARPVSKLPVEVSSV